jgi:hypothetical protein
MQPIAVEAIAGAIINFGNFLGYLGELSGYAD